MANFLALYRGPSISEAALVAVSVDPSIVADFAARLLSNPTERERGDRALEAIDQGRRQALRVVRSEAARAAAEGAE